MKKYELLQDDFKFIGETKLYRIKALIDIPRYGVKAGDLGGYIEKEENLSHLGNCWVSGNAKVSGNACVYDNTRVYGNALVYGDTRVSGNARVYEDARVFGNAKVHGNAWVSGNAWVYDNACVTGNAWVSGNARVYEDAMVSGNAWVYEDAMVSGNAWVSDDACVYGNAYVSGNCSKTPICLSGFKYHVTICDDVMTIGCQTHKIEKWMEFTKEKIEEMGGMSSVEEWEKNKNILFSIIDSRK